MSRKKRRGPLVDIEWFARLLAPPYGLSLGSSEICQFASFEEDSRLSKMLWLYSWCTHNFRFEFKNLLSITIRIMAQKNLFLFNQVDGRTSLFYNCVHVSNEFL